MSTVKSQPGYETEGMSAERQVKNGEDGKYFGENKQSLLQGCEYFCVKAKKDCRDMFQTSSDCKLTVVGPSLHDPWRPHLQPSRPAGLSAS